MVTILRQPGPSQESSLKKYIWPSWTQRKRALFVQAWVFLMVSYLLLAFSYLWPTDFRNISTTYVIVTTIAFMIRVFLYHIGLVVAAITIMAGIWRKWRLLIACGPLLVVTLGVTWWPSALNPAPARVYDPFKVMSVNLLMINRDCSPIISEIRVEKPDVLLLQEYTRHWHKALQESIGADYPYIIHQCQEDSFGTAIYSRYPFAEQPTRALPLGSTDVPQIRAVLAIAGRNIAIYNIHLLPPRRLDYIIEQQTQWADLLDLLADEALPVVVGGDFNFTERTPHASAITHLGFADAHDVAGRGRGATWPVHGLLRYVPGIRLDHIYLSRPLIPLNCRTGDGNGSDHRPVIVDIGWAETSTTAQSTTRSTAP